MTDQSKTLPTLERILYDQMFGTDTRYGLGPEQIFVDPVLAKSTITAILTDPNRSFTGIDIDTFVNTQLNFDTPEDIIATMNAIYDNFQVEDVNYIFFQVLQDAFVNKLKFEEIFKTSWVALQVRQNVTAPRIVPQVQLNLEEGGVCFVEEPQLSPTPTPSVTPSVSPSASPVTPTPTPTITRTVSFTPTVTPTATATQANTATPTPTVTGTSGVTPTVTPTMTATPTITATSTVTPTVTPTNTVTPTVTATNTATPSVTPTESPAVTPTVTAIPTQTPTPTSTVTPTVTPTPSLPAALSQGFTAGGNVGTTLFDTVDSYPFAAPATSVTDVGNLSATKYSVGGASSTTDGYVAGGSTTPGVANTTTAIDQFPFAAPFITATVIGNLSPTSGLYETCGVSGVTDGYNVGGYRAPGWRSAITQWPYSSPFTLSTNVGNLTAVHGGVAGANSDTTGYAMGGTQAATNNIESFPFASPFTTAADIGDLNNSGGRRAGISSDTDGYAAGGQAPGTISQIDSFPFASPFTLATDVGDLQDAQYGGAGSRSETDGYVAGGLTSPVTLGRIVQTFPFSAPFVTTSLHIAAYPTARSKGTGHQG